MALSSIAAIALQGLREQAKNLETTAGNIADADRAEYRLQEAAPSAGDSDLIQLDEDELAYRANAAVFEAGADLWDILGVVTRD